MTALSPRSALLGVLLTLLCTLTGCAARPGSELKRTGDEIVIAGRLFHTGAPVVLWSDPGGYDAYRTERRFVPFQDAGWDKSKDALAEPARFNLRFQRSTPDAYTPDQLDQVRGGGWDLELLRSKVDQFVIHYDVCGTSRTCFRVLHDMRGLSIHFMLDLDGTIYQTLDVKERAWHATIANDRSIGVEIANIGAYPPDKANPLAEWYAPELAPDGSIRRTRVTIPARLDGGGVRTPDFAGFTARPAPITGEIQHQMLVMYDLTPQQYDSLVKLTATLCRVLPGIKPTYPTDAQGTLVPHALSADEWKAYQGVLGHYHIQENKTDPGPAFNWPEYMARVRRELDR